MRGLGFTAVTGLVALLLSGALSRLDVINIATSQHGNRLLCVCKIVLCLQNCCDFYSSRHAGRFLYSISGPKASPHLGRPRSPGIRQTSFQ